MKGVDWGDSEEQEEDEYAERCEPSDCGAVLKDRKGYERERKRVEERRKEELCVFL